MNSRTDATAPVETLVETLRAIAVHHETWARLHGGRYSLDGHLARAETLRELADDLKTIVEFERMPIPTVEAEQASEEAWQRIAKRL